MKKYEVTFMEDMQTGETAVHDIPADHVELVEGNLCFYEDTSESTSIPLLFRVKKKMVASYAAGIWVAFHEYEDDLELAIDPQWDDAEFKASLDGLTAFVPRKPFGKDGSIGG